MTILTIITGLAPDDMLVRAMNYSWAGFLGFVIVGFVLVRWMRRNHTRKVK